MSPSGLIFNTTIRPHPNGMGYNDAAPDGAYLDTGSLKRHQARAEPLPQPDTDVSRRPDRQPSRRASILGLLNTGGRS